LGECVHLPLGQAAVVIGFALGCSLAINDPVKVAILARHRASYAVV
jgi:hypothetical protein